MTATTIQASADNTATSRKCVLLIDDHGTERRYGPHTSCSAQGAANAAQGAANAVEQPAARHRHGGPILGCHDQHPTSLALPGLAPRWPAAREASQRRLRSRARRQRSSGPSAGRPSRGLVRRRPLPRPRARSRASSPTGAKRRPI